MDWSLAQLPGPAENEDDFFLFRKVGLDAPESIWDERELKALWHQGEPVMTGPVPAS